MKFKQNLLLPAVLIIFSLQLIGLGVLFCSPVNEVRAQNAGAGYPPGTGYSNLEGKTVTPQISGSDSGNATLTPGGINFIPQVDIPGSEFVKGEKVPISGLMIAQYIQAWYKFAVAAVGILAVVMIMGGGLIWLTAGGEANKISTAKDWIMGAVVGLVLALMSYTLLDILNPSLVTFKELKIPDIEFVDSGVCCFSQSGPKPANSADVNDKCQEIETDADGKAKKDGKVIDTGTRCNMLQACIDTIVMGQYHCVDRKKGDWCGSPKECQEGWFCVKNGCSSGSIGDECDIKEKSCAPGYYCSYKYGVVIDSSFVCYDGRMGDICNIENNECNPPMICKYYDDFITTGVNAIIDKNYKARCQYDRNQKACFPLGAQCPEKDNDVCCEGDCEGFWEGNGVWNPPTCVIPN